jgi:glycine oxidase
MPISDVVVVGAGVIGCACAYELAAAGARVHVIDTRRVGQGASQASAGVLAPYIEGHESTDLRTLGRKSLDLYDEFAARTIEESGITVQYDRSGTLEVAFEEQELARFRVTADALSQDGIDARVLDADALREYEPLASTGARGGLLIGIHGFVGVPDFTEALAIAARRKGVQFTLDTRVVSIREAGGRPSIDTDRGTYTPDAVVLAAGSWVGQISITGVEPILIKPIRGQLLHLAWQTSQPLRRVVWGAECYIVPWRNGRVLVGATVEDAGFDERATAAGVRDLLEAACTLIPHLWQATFSEVRVGLRPQSPDGLPIIGRSQVVPGLVYATGHYRNGVLLAPLTATLVKTIVLQQGDDPVLQTVAPARLGPKL